MEMLVVLALLSLFVTMGAVAIDPGQQQANTEYQQFVNLLRRHHVHAIQDGKERSINIDPTNNSLTVTSHDGKDLHSFQFKFWNVTQPLRPFQLILTTTGVYGPRHIELKNRNTTRQMTTDMLETIREN